MQEQLRCLADIKERNGDTTTSVLLRQAANEIDDLRAYIREQSRLKDERIKFLSVLLS